MRVRRSGQFHREQKTEGFDEKSQRDIDHPRPMHEAAARRIEPVGRHVEPALASEKRAHLHEPHGIVRVVYGTRLPDRGDKRPGQQQPEADGQ